MIYVPRKPYSILQARNNKAYNFKIPTYIIQFKGTHTYYKEQGYDKFASQPNVTQQFVCSNK